MKLRKFQTFTHMKNLETCFCPMDQGKTPKGKPVFSERDLLIFFSKSTRNEISNTYQISALNFEPTAETFSLENVPITTSKSVFYGQQLILYLPRNL